MHILRRSVTSIHVLSRRPHTTSTDAHYDDISHGELLLVTRLVEQFHGSDIFIYAVPFVSDGFVVLWCHLAYRYLMTLLTGAETWPTSLEPCRTVLKLIS